MKTLARILRWVRSSRLSKRSQPLETTVQVVVWWELRRIAFNVAVGLAGSLSLILVFGAAVLSEQLIGEPVGLPDPPLFLVVPVLLYAIAANLFYTMGWVAELIARNTFETDSSAFASTAFAMGLLGSVLLTIAVGAVFSSLVLAYVVYALSADHAR